MNWVMECHTAITLTSCEPLSLACMTMDTMTEFSRLVCARYAHDCPQTTTWPGLFRCLHRLLKPHTNTGGL